MNLYIFYHLSAVIQTISRQRYVPTTSLDTDSNSNYIYPEEFRYTRSSRPALDGASAVLTS